MNVTNIVIYPYGRDEYFPLSLELAGCIGWYRSDGEVHFDNPVDHFEVEEKKEWFIETLAEGLGQIQEGDLK